MPIPLDSRAGEIIVDWVGSWRCAATHGPQKKVKTTARAAPTTTIGTPISQRPNFVWEQKRQIAPDTSESRQVKTPAAIAKNAGESKFGPQANIAASSSLFLVPELDSEKAAGSSRPRAPELSPSWSQWPGTATRHSSLRRALWQSHSSEVFGR